MITYDTTPSPQSAGESELPRYTLEDFQVRGSCLKLEEQPDEKRKERKRIRRSKWLKVLVVLIVGLIITAIVLAVVLAKVK